MISMCWFCIAIDWLVLELTINSWLSMLCCDGNIIIYVRNAGITVGGDGDSRLMNDMRVSVSLYP